MPAPVAVAEVAKLKRSPTLMPDRIGLAEDKCHDFVVDASVGTTIEDITDPSYWALVASQMDPFDHIRVRAEDGSWIAYLVVVMCERTYAKVHLDRVIEFKQNMEIPQSSIKHKVEWKGTVNKFSVIRTKDDAVLQNGFKSREEADAWLRNHERSQ